MNQRRNLLIGGVVLVLFFFFWNDWTQHGREQAELALLQEALTRRSTQVKQLEQRLGQLVERLGSYSSRNDDLVRKIKGLVDSSAVEAAKKELGDREPQEESKEEQQQQVPAHKEGEEHNVPIHEPRHDDEKKFKHELRELPIVPNDEPNVDVLVTVRSALQKYQDLVKGGGKAPYQNAVPVYGTACVEQADCQYVIDQMRALDTAVQHIVIVMSGHHREADVLFTSMEKLFGGQVTIFRRPGVTQGCAEAWNTILRAAFAIRPTPAFTMITNADLYVKSGYLAKFANFNIENHHKVAANKFMHFSSFSITDYGYAEVGGFDEVIYPAYAEDVEFHIRCVSKGLFVDSFPENNHNTHRHVGSRSFSNPGFREKWQRWDKPEYIWRKWGVSMKDYNDYAGCKPYKTPFNLPIPHQKSFVVDPQHRHCILTGNGPKHEGPGGCMLSQCDSCWYDGRVLAKHPALEGKNVDIPERLYSRSHIHDKRG